MSNRFQFLLAALLMLATLRTVPCAADDNKSASAKYPSPTAVFDAWRKAWQERDLKKAYSCLTVAKQNDLLYELIFLAADGPARKEYAAIGERHFTGKSLKEEYRGKYGVDGDDAALDRYEREEYSGEAAKKLKDFHGSETQRKQLEDDASLEIVVNFLARHIKDKPGYYDEMIKARYGDEPIPSAPYGDLESLDIRGDTATGNAKTVTAGYLHRFGFRLVNGGWLIGW